MRNNILRKGQLQLMESTIVLFVFFLIIIVGMVIYTNIQAARYNELTQEINDQQAVMTARKILSMPELECSSLKDIQEDCFEAQKLDGFIEVVQQNGRYYREELGDTKVIVKSIIPSDESDRILFDFSSNLENKKTFYFPVTIKSVERNGFGWMIVEAYS